MFESASRGEAQARLNHLIELRGIGLLTGEVGSGKTTVCRHVAEALHPGLYRVCYVALTTGNVLDMYKCIGWQLGLPTERSRATAYRAIQSEITRLVTEAKQLPVLIVDEAQHTGADNWTIVLSKGVTRVSFKPIRTHWGKRHDRAGRIRLKPTTTPSGPLRRILRPTHRTPWPMPSPT